jgi:hypothetical protein
MTLHATFTDGLYSYQQWARVFFSPYPHQCLLSIVCLIIAIFIKVRLYFIVDFIGKLLMISNVEHFFHVSLGCLSSFDKFLLRFIPYFVT